MRRVAAVVALALTLIVGVLVGTAYASTTTTLGSTGVTVTRAQQDYTSPSWGFNIAFFVECPSGTKLLGGGAWARHSGSEFIPMKGSWPDDSTGKWYVVYDIPNTPSVEVHVFATCADLN